MAILAIMANGCRCETFGQDPALRVMMWRNPVGGRLPFIRTGRLKVGVLSMIHALIVIRHREQPGRNAATMPMRCCRHGTTAVQDGKHDQQSQEPTHRHPLTTRSVARNKPTVQCSTWLRKVAVRS
jgi:hypothetical protein